LPGHTPGRIGQIFVLDNLLLESQSQANSLAGLVFADKNNPYPDIPLRMNGNNRAFDIAPVLYGTVTINEYSGVIIPRSIEYAIEDSKLMVDISFKAATTEEISTNGDIPIGDGTYLTPGLGAFPSLPKFDFTVPDLPPLDFPGLGDPNITTPCETFISNQFPLSWSRTNLDGTNSDTLTAHAYFPCKIRASGSFAESYIKLNGLWGGDSKNFWHVYATLGGSRILTATVTHNTNGNFAYFAPISDTEIDGFDFEIDAGIGSIITGATPGSIITSGSVNAAGWPSVDLQGFMTVNNWYAIEGTGGPWYWADFSPWTGWPNYGFSINGSGYVGWDGNSQPPSVPTLKLTTPADCLLSEAIDTYYGRVYYQDDGATCLFRTGVGGGSRADDTGTMGYILKNASVYGRVVQLYNSTLYNVCAI